MAVSDLQRVNDQELTVNENNIDGTEGVGDPKSNSA